MVALVLLGDFCAGESVEQIHRGVQRVGFSLCPLVSMRQHPWSGEKVLPISATPETRNGLEGQLASAFLRMGQEEGKNHRKRDAT